MARIAQVKTFNQLMKQHGLYTYVMTLGNGSMIDQERKNGYIVFESPRLGDNNDYAKWYPNQQEAVTELESRV